jgi:hypothetical protein
LHRLVQFWKRFYEICDAKDKDNHRPTKRQRTGYFSASSSFGNLMKGHYKLPASYLLASIVKDCCCDDRQNWQVLHDKVHALLPKYFKTFTVEDVQAGLTLLGLQCMYQGQAMDGLTSSWILQDYLSRTG